MNTESNNNLKEINIKNRTCCYFDAMIITFYKTLIDANPLRIRFDKVDGFIRIYC